MHSDELRTGDLIVNESGDIVVANHIYISMLRSWERTLYTQRPPFRVLELSEDILDLFFGSFKRVSSNEWVDGSLLIRSYGKVFHLRQKTGNSSVFICALRYAHELQSIYRIIFKQELVIKI